MFDSFSSFRDFLHEESLHSFIFQEVLFVLISSLFVSLEGKRLFEVSKISETPFLIVK